MKYFEAKLAQAIVPSNRDAILGAIGLVIDAKGIMQTQSIERQDVRSIDLIRGR